jgi:branched-chain amino acid transport system substrate-binding protein
MKVMGLKLAAETSHKPTDTDFTASVARLRDAKCDLLLLGSIVRDTNQIIAAVRKTGWKVDMLGPVAAYDEAVADVPGGATEGFYAMTSVLFATPDDPRPAVQKFVKDYKARFGKDPNFAAQIGYTGAQLLMLGLEKAGKDLTLDSFIAGMESIKDYHDIFGSPPMGFGPKKRQGSNESFLAQVHDGHWVAVSPEPIGY